MSNNNNKGEKTLDSVAYYHIQLDQYGYEQEEFAMSIDLLADFNSLTFRVRVNFPGFSETPIKRPMSDKTALDRAQKEFQKLKERYRKPDYITK